MILLNPVSAIQSQCADVFVGAMAWPNGAGDGWPDP
jgi:hypothetical protein